MRLEKILGLIMVGSVDVIVIRIFLNLGNNMGFIKPFCIFCEWKHDSLKCEDCGFWFCELRYGYHCPRCGRLSIKVEKNKNNFDEGKNIKD